MPSPVPLPPSQRRSSVVLSYLTPEQKAAAAALGRAVDLTQSDLVRLLLVTSTPESVEQLKRHPAHLAILEEEATR